MFQGLEHVAISSPNPQNLAAWYVEYLGFHINFTYAGNYFVKAPNGTMIEIIANPLRLDLHWIHCKRAKSLGGALTDAEERAVFEATFRVIPAPG